MRNRLKGLIKKRPKLFYSIAGIAVLLILSTAFFLNHFQKIYEEYVPTESELQALMERLNDSDLITDTDAKSPSEGSSGNSQFPGKLNNEQTGPVSDGLTEFQKYAYSLANPNATNILIVGIDNSSYGIYDSIVVLSIDEKQKNNKVIMFPRDIYVDYSQKIKDEMDKIYPGYFDTSHAVHRLNNLHNIGIQIKFEGKMSAWSMNIIAAYMEEVYDIQISDYIRIDTTTFSEFIDLFGGVELDVPYDMYYDDPSQDLHIALDKGLQNLTGTQAEGFVRFRQGTDRTGEKQLSIGDIRRKENQIIFIKEFINQHGTISNVDRIDDLYKLFKNKIKTSITPARLTRYISLLTKAVSMNYSFESHTVKGTVGNVNGKSYYFIEESK